MDISRHPGAMQERLDRAQAGMPEVLTASSEEDASSRPAQ